MPKSCTICRDPRRDEIDRGARIENDIAKISRKFALSYDSLYRHIKANHHIREITAVPTTSELSRSEDILKEINEHHSEAKRLRDQAKSAGDLKTALLGIDKALKCLELMAKIQGQIQEQNINMNLQQLNIYDSPEWISLKTKIVEALRSYPQAQRAVLLAISK